MSRHLTRPRDKRIIWLYGQERIKVDYVPAKFGDHRHSDSGDIMVLICHIISQDHLIKGSWDFTGWSPSRLSYQSAKLGDHKNCDSRYIFYSLSLDLEVMTSPVPVWLVSFDWTLGDAPACKMWWSYRNGDIN